MTLPSTSVRIDDGEPTTNEQPSSSSLPSLSSSTALSSSPSLTEPELIGRSGMINATVSANKVTSRQSSHQFTVPRPRRRLSRRRLSISFDPGLLERHRHESSQSLTSVSSSSSSSSTRPEKGEEATVSRNPEAPSLASAPVLLGITHDPAMPLCDLASLLMPPKIVRSSTTTVTTTATTTTMQEQDGEGEDHITRRLYCERQSRRVGIRRTSCVF